MRFSTVNQVNSERLNSSRFAQIDYRSWQVPLTSHAAWDWIVSGTSIWMNSSPRHFDRRSANSSLVAIESENCGANSDTPINSGAYSDARSNKLPCCKTAPRRRR